MSPRDCTKLLRAAVQTEGMTFAVGNEISANRYRVADLTETMKMLDYPPVDDAWNDQ